jgi:hypothetical protein
MHGWVQVKGDIKTLTGEAPAAFVVELISRVPTETIVDYLFHYLEAGTLEECQHHPALRDAGNVACAVLTYRYLRPRMQMLINRRTQWLAERPDNLGTELFADDIVRVWELKSPPRRD